MSGYGGNLTYPETKNFWNNPTVDPAGAAGDFLLITDLKVGVGATTLFLPSTGDYVPGGSGNGAAYSQVDHADAVSRVINVVLTATAPCDTCNHELGFILKAIAQHPGVMNDNFYGQLRTYAHKFETLDPITGGLVSDADLMRAYSDINQQITDDTGRYNGHMQGNYEAIVNTYTYYTFDGAIAGATYDIPALGIYGALITDNVNGYLVSDYIDVAGDPIITNQTAVIPGYGFIVHPPAAEILTAHRLRLSTKPEYRSEYTFMTQEVSGTHVIDINGSFELLPWAEVYREFAHMEHMVPLSNHHADEKPGNIVWSKFLLYTDHRTGTFHGASHGANYKEALSFYVPTADAADMATLLDLWIA